MAQVDIVFRPSSLLHVDYVGLASPALLLKCSALPNRVLDLFLD